MLRPTEHGWLLADVTQMHVPSLVRQLVIARLRRLGSDVESLLAVAAVLGQDVSLDLWQTVAQVTEETLCRAVERATVGHLLEEARDGTRVRFVHALVREAIYDDIAPSRRRVMHRQIGEALAASPHPDPDAVASHFQRATDARALEWLIKAGEQAQRSWAWLTAADRYETALTILGETNTGMRAELLYFVALLRQFVSPAKGVILLEDAQHLAATAGDHLLAACALFMRGALRCYVGDFRRGLTDLETGAAALDALAPIDSVRLEALDVGGDDLGEHVRWGGVAAWLALLGRYAEARALASRVSTLIKRTLPTNEPESKYGGLYRALGIAYASLGEPSTAIEAYSHCLQSVRACGDYYAFAIATLDELERVALPYYADQVTRRRILAETVAEAWSQAPGVFQGSDTSGLAHLLVLFLEGAWTEARRLALIVRATQELTALRRVATRVLGSIARHQGDADLAWTLVWEVLHDGPDASPGDYRFLDTQVMQQLAIGLASDAGDLPLARAWLGAHDRWLAWSGAVYGRAEACLGWAAHYRAAGDLDDAYEHATRSLAHASDSRQPLALLAAHRLLGELDTEASRFTEAETHLDTALALADACAAPYERALTLLARAELRIAQSRPREAAVLVEETRAICVPLDAKPALARAGALIARIMPQIATLYPARLTEREVGVLRLLAAGHTNRQIAEMLCLSERTVHVHVRNIFAKTGTDNRAGATAFAFRHDLA